MSLKNKWTLGRGHFWPQGYNLNNRDRGSLDDATYQIVKAGAFYFQTRTFLKFFPYMSLENKWPPGRGNFWPQGFNLNTPDRGLLEDATYQISKVWVFYFQTRRFFPIWVFEKQVTPGEGSFLTPGL